MEESHPKFNWSAAETIDSFAVVRQNDGKGKCGYDAPRRALNSLGFEVGELKDYHHQLLLYVTKCKTLRASIFRWKWNTSYSDDSMYDKIERVKFGTGKQLKRSDDIWVDVRDFMLVSGCFQVPAFVYSDPQGKTRSKKKDNGAHISTTIFVPIGNAVVSVLRKSEITLPFKQKSLCLYFANNHYQWMSMKDNNDNWSSYTSARDPLHVSAECADKMLNAEQLHKQFKQNNHVLEESEKK